MASSSDTLAQVPDAQSGDLARVAALRAGDESVFRELVDAWSPAMLRLAGNFVSNHAAAQDVVQDAWLGVLRGLDSFEGRSSLRAWVFTIVANRARTHGARDARTIAASQLGPEDVAGPTVDPSRFQGPDGEYPRHWTSAGAPQRWETSPEQRALTGEALSVIESAVDQLPVRQRQVITLRDIHGLTSEEACEVLEITPQNQRVLLHRARATLRGVLEEYYRC